MSGIMYLLEDDRERELYEIYCAQCLWETVRSIYGLVGSDFNMPQYVEIIIPETARKEQTAQEIKDHIIKRLLEE